MTIHSCDLCGAENRVYTDGLKCPCLSPTDICQECAERLKDIVKYQSWRIGERAAAYRRCAEIAASVKVDPDSPHEVGWRESAERIEDLIRSEFGLGGEA
jgi:hypothetical protein